VGIRTSANRSLKASVIANHNRAKPLADDAMVIVQHDSEAVVGRTAWHSDPVFLVHVIEVLRHSVPCRKQFSARPRKSLSTCSVGLRLERHESGLLCPSHRCTLFWRLAAHLFVAANNFASYRP
jgi:hypothetical protein